MTKENGSILLNTPSPRCWRTRPLPQGARGTARGFTLIELLVVVLIIGILAAVAVPQYKKAVYKTRYTTLKNFSESLAKAERVYFLANGSFTENLEELDIELSGGQFDDSTPKKYVWDSNFCDAVLSTSEENKLNVHCTNNTIGMGYYLVLLPDQTRRNCYVLGSAVSKELPLQNQICQGETGLSKPTSTNKDQKYVRYQY